MGWIKENINLMSKEEILYDTDNIQRDSEGNYLIDIAYRRVSTEKQSLDGFGLDSQLEKIKACCRKNDSTACILITDDGFTGTVMERPGMDCFIKRLTDFNRGLTKIRIRRLIVPRMDRLGRDIVGMLSFINDYILPKGGTKSTVNENRYLVEFISEEESNIRIVTTENGELDPTSHLLIVIFSLLADLDRKAILRKFRSGKAQRVASGYPLGGGNVPYGYRYVENTKDKKGNYETIPEQKEKFLEARRLFVEEHLPPSTIAEELNLSTERLVTQMLKRRTYLNILTYNGVEYPGHFEAFITEEQWQEQQDEFERRSRARCDTTYMLTGLVYCGNCGAKFRYQKESATGNVKLSCYSKEHSHAKRHLVKDPNCPNKTRYYAKDIEDIVIRELFRLSYINQDNKKTVTDFDIISSLEKEIEKNQKALNKATMEYAMSDTDSAKGKAYAATIDRLSEEIERLVSQVKSEREKRNIKRKIEKTKSTIKNLADAWPHMTDEERRTVCREVIDRIVITHTDGDPEISIHFHLEQYLNK